MPPTRNPLTPEALTMLQAVADHGSLAGAARALGLVPSALSYRVRQLEEALDVLLFDRSTRQARLTEAGTELLREGARLLAEIDAVANRVRRVATGWEPQLTIALDTVIAPTPVMELAATFYELAAPTRLKLLDESLLGTVQAVTQGHADLAIGTVADAASLSYAAPGVHSRWLGELRFVYCVAPQHPLARLAGPLTDARLRQHRAVATADSSRSGQGMTVNLVSGQDVLTVPSTSAKLLALLHGLGGGFLPEPMARLHIAAGHLVACETVRSVPLAQLHCAWRVAAHGQSGRAMQWWLARLDSDTTRRALLQGHEARRSTLDA
ncbi:LysR family transcriptional regulator [Ottowia sp.]|uniref:LysR family transcriptional regulator n=1 Tax=Ottowia sp. TaxID=1898956 RepID=UPI003A839C0F